MFLFHIRHARALVVSAFLIIYPMWLLLYLWRSDSISTWLLAVSTFSLEIIVKMIISLIIYVLFLLDFYRETFWEELDDYVYYIRSFGNSVSIFKFNIFIVLILMFIISKVKVSKYNHIKIKTWYYKVNGRLIYFMRTYSTHASVFLTFLKFSS